MVTERLLCAAVYPEALPLCVVVLVHLPALPIVAFDAEVVVPLRCQAGLSVTRFQQALCQGYGSRHAAALHFADGYCRILRDILFLRGVSPCKDQQRQQHREQESYLFHLQLPISNSSPSSAATVAGKTVLHSRANTERSFTREE